MAARSSVAKSTSQDLKLVGILGACCNPSIMSGARYPTELKILRNFARAEKACNRTHIYFEANVEGQTSANSEAPCLLLHKKTLPNLLL